MGPPQELIIQLQQNYDLLYFVETGTYYGATALWAAQHFQKVITIEFSQEIYNQVSSQYQNLEGIEFLFGDTREQLTKIVPQFKKPCLFWLDAHWSGGNTYGANDECPLIEELEIIARTEVEHFIIIDDARLFLSPPPYPHRAEKWPSISTVINTLSLFCQDRYTVIFEDVIVSVPNYARNLVTQYCQGVNYQVINISDKSIVNSYPVQEGVKNSDQKPQLNLKNTGEIQVIKQFIHPGDIVFDVGANQGNWTKEVLNKHHDVQVHLFEPVHSTYHRLLKNLNQEIINNEVLPNNLAVSRQREIRHVWHYEDAPSWSTFHRRSDIEKSYNLTRPNSFAVFTTTVDQYCSDQGIERINFLKVDTEGNELEVLLGAKHFLRRGKIDYIQFEYGGTFLDARISLKEVFNELQKYRYSIFKIFPNRLEYRRQFKPEYENFEYSNFLAINERFRSSILDEVPTMLDWQNLCVQHSVKPRGVIHIGAHEGKELERYQAMGVERVLFIEANPEVFERLQTTIAGYANVEAVNCAISNANGTVTLHITSMDQSSSILSLKRHKDLYPDIQETHQLIVKSKTLDTLLKELEFNLTDFNILNMDIQGAELLALQGATNWLKYVDAINTEVNYEELYEGCALIDQVDNFLERHGFERVATTSPYHPSWGDAFYVRTPVITMSTLGKNGRFANQIFQYAFLKIYAKEHNLRVETPTWIGQYLFGHSEPPISKQFPLVIEETNELSEACIPNCQEVFQNVDFWGYFQYNTKYYAPHKEYFRSLFKPVPEVEIKITAALERLRSRGKTVVGLHLRRGDYGYEHFFVAPNQWYKEWLKGFWETLNQPILFIASDEPEKVIGDFIEYKPITTQELEIELSEAEFYPDFFLLSQCDVVAISNSSFSFAACLLNERAKFFFRPHMQTEKLIPFDPWNSESIFRNVKRVDDTLPEVQGREAKNSLVCQANLLSLKLRSINLIVFPDWSQPEELLYLDFEKLLRTIITHPDRSYMTLLIESSSMPDEEAELALSSIVMNLLWQEDLDVSDEPKITVIPKLTPMHWKALLPNIHRRIILDNENQQAIAHFNAGSLPVCKLDSLISAPLS
jgi:FkbM family methyltransferase